MRLARDLGAQGVDRCPGGKEDRLQIGAAKSEVGRDLGRADDAEPRAVGCEHPGPPGPVQKPGPVGRPSCRRERRRFRPTTCRQKSAARPCCRPSRARSRGCIGRNGYWRRRASVRRAKMRDRSDIEFGDEAVCPVRVDGDKRPNRQFLVGERHPQPGVGKIDAAVRTADDVVRPIDPLALKAVHHNRAVMGRRTSG